MTLVNLLTLSKSLISWPHFPCLQNEWVALKGVTRLFIKMCSIIQYTTYYTQKQKHVTLYATHSLCCTVQCA